MVQTNKVLGKKLKVLIPSTSGMIKKTDYNTKIREIENTISSITGLVTSTVLNIKATEIVNKIPTNITNLAKKAAQKWRVKCLASLIWLPRLLSI